MVRQAYVEWGATEEALDADCARPFVYVEVRDRVATLLVRAALKRPRPDEFNPVVRVSSGPGDAP